MTDQEIMDGMANNDPKAFVAFERKYKERVFAVARKIFNFNIMPFTLEEIFYEVLLGVWLKLIKNEKIKELGAFVATIARNKSINKLNYQKKHQTLNQTEEILNGDPNPLDKIIQEEFLKILQKQIQRIDPIEQKILHLRFNEELKIHEIAQKLNLNTPAVGQRLRRTIVKIRNMTQNRGEF